ncbi:DNA-binding MurR/RpiR family transcriptional regulator [Rhizobium aquaticum]|uniref:DNA-binding MurR/RpiR family transcriptional regulator n=1 Tax=Rhizobium aquaticum TaxID=1549636 RepID=A0ABV2J0Q1_9HYPH
MPDVNQTGAAPPADFESLKAQVVGNHVKLPKRLKQAAAYALENPDEIAFGTAASIAQAACVQPSTLVRLAHQFGYDGFSHFQTIFKERLRLRTPSYEERLTQIEKSADAAPEAALLHGFFGAARSSIARMEEAIREEDFKRAIEVLGAAETIYLIAKRRSYALTAHLSYAFSKLGIRHQLVASANGVDMETVQFARPEDAALAISFSPYAAESLDHARALHAQGVPLVSITDSAFSPLASISTLWFEVAEADFAGFRSLSASMALTMALSVGIAEYRRHQQNDTE